MKKRITLCFVIVSLILTCFGCDYSNPDKTASESESDKSTVLNQPNNQPDTGAEPHIFRFYDDGYASSLIIDQNGNEITDEKETLYDLLTGEPQCQIHVKYINTGKTHEYGLPIAKKMVAIFDMNGNMIQDYAERVYTAAFGDFLLSSRWIDGFELDTSQDYDEKLWNFKTNQTVLDDVGRISVLNKEKKLFIACSYSDELLGTIDINGNFINTTAKQTKPFYSWVNTWNGMIITSHTFYNETNSELETTKSILYDEALKPILTAKHISNLYDNLNNDYLEIKNDNQGIIYNKDLEKCFEFGVEDSLQFFDGELAIMLVGMPGDWSSILTDENNNILADGYKTILPIKEIDQKIKIENFIAVKSDKICILDRSGDIVASKDIVYANSCEYLGNGIITYTTYDKEFKGDKAVLLDMDLNVLLPDENYFRIDRRYDTDSSISGKNGRFRRYDTILLCYYNIGENSGMCYDIYDNSLNLIMSRVKYVHGISNDRIAVTRGFSRGLIDYQGNWVNKYSIFNNFQTEDR